MLFVQSNVVQKVSYHRKGYYVAEVLHLTEALESHSNYFALRHGWSPRVPWVYGGVDLDS